MPLPPPLARIAPSNAARTAAIGLLLVALFLPALGSTEAGTHPDEQLYLGISAEMDATGSWLSPTLAGSPTWQKPPLLYWAERLAYLALGRGVFAGRLPTAAAAMALALLAGLLAARMSGRREAGELAALLMATALGTLKFGRLAMMDVPLAAALTGAALASWIAVEEKRPRALLGAGVAVGLAFLLKGPVAAVVAALAFGGFAALRDRALLRSRWLLAGVAACALVALPWFVAMTAVHGAAFLKAFFVGENLARFANRWTLGKELELLGGFLVFLLPWTLLPAGRLREMRGLRAAPPEVLLPLLWIAATLLVFTIPGHKYPHYGIACAPAAIVLAACATPPRWALRATAALLALLAAALLVGTRWPFPPLARAGMLVGAGLLFAAAFFAARARLRASAACTGLAAALAFAVVLPGVSPPFFPPEAAAATAQRPLFTFDYQPGNYGLVSGREVRRLWSSEQVAGALAQGGAVLMWADSFEGLPTEVRERAAVLARWPRIARSPDVARVLESFRRAELAPLHEQMVAVGPR